VPFWGSYSESLRRITILKDRTQNINILLTGGGTGGHYFPAAAIAGGLKDAINNRYPEIRVNLSYIGSDFGIEKQRHPERIFNNVYYLQIKGFARSFYKGAILNNLMFPFRILFSCLKVRRIFTETAPSMVIATGGYVSGLPGREAIRRKIPLYIQEQNAWPGITTRLLAKKSRYLFYAYNDVLSKINLNAGTQYIFAPNPVRQSLKRQNKESSMKKWDLVPDRKTIFIFGGSQGSRNINNHIATIAPGLVKDLPLQILWQTGEKNYKDILTALKDVDHIHLHPFIEDMVSAYSSSDLIISRAGALTLSELERMRKPAILIPLPTAAANHQYHNAMAFQKKGVAKVITEDMFRENTVDRTIRELILHPESLEDLENHYPENPENGLKIIVQSIIKDLPFEEPVRTY
jgi:UDP-N-acetylglucosamine--N-acetylmuramyl-(pentapeptide) pyrophosphoryl-undecaprenol N-acetylglucosamine transferase